MNSEEFRYLELADFLKTRRARISPMQLGLSSVTRRRTPGLRREEIAQLAGVGLTWYSWLEQGRAIHVSTPVIESLSRVLMLDKQERMHLYHLANQPVPADITGNQTSISPLLQHVLDSLELCPSIIADQRWNVIGWNRAAVLILGDLEKMYGLQRNIVWGMFMDNYYRRLYVNWELHAKSTLGRFRSSCGKYIEDTWFVQLIEELKANSPEFNEWWPLHDIYDDSGVYKQFNHPVAGTLEFESSCFDVPDNSGLRLFIHVPLSETDSSLKMRQLLDRDIHAGV